MKRSEGKNVSGYSSCYVNSRLLQNAWERKPNIALVTDLSPPLRTSTMGERGRTPWRTRFPEILVGQIEATDRGSDVGKGVYVLV